MKKKYIFIILLLVIIISALIFGTIKLITNNSNETDKLNVGKEKEIYLNIIKNDEKNGELSLNTNEKVKYYYFDIVNYNEEENQYNETNITPYVKINFNNNDETNLIQWNLYNINNEENTEENWIEITEKGDTGTNFEEYYKCAALDQYNSENLNQNVQHYVLKIVLNTENEKFSTLEEDLTENFSIVLGYREIK
ncbi:MAG: hypothetical protein ACI4UE_04985 [Candidatus Scatovivens sp.]